MRPPTLWVLNGSRIEQRRVWPTTPTLPKIDPDALDPAVRRQLTQIAGYAGVSHARSGNRWWYMAKDLVFGISGLLFSRGE